MQLSIRGCKSNKLSLRETRFAIHWFAELVIPKRVLNKIEVNIKLLDIEEDGFVEFVTDEPELMIFDLGLNKNNDKKTQLLTIAHEVAHIKFYATREMHYNKDNSIVWRKQVITEDLPWEDEAFRLEKIMYKKYMAFKRKMDSK